MSKQPTTVAVFGSSEPVPDSPPYLEAFEIGRALGRAGFAVITGGYGGVMEAASRGADSVGAPVVGVTCRIFDRRRGNRWISEEVPTSDLHERTRVLIERSDAFVVLPGKAGTLAEASLLWALHRAGCLSGKPLVAVGPAWAGLLRYLGEHGWLDPEQRALTLRAIQSDEVVDLLESHLSGRSEERR